MPTGNLSKRCRWVLVPGADAKYCERPVEFATKLDDDHKRVRVYAYLCEEHKRKSVETASKEKDDASDVL